MIPSAECNYRKPPVTAEKIAERKERILAFNFNELKTFGQRNQRPKYVINHNIDERKKASYSVENYASVATKLLALGLFTAGISVGNAAFRLKVAALYFHAAILCTQAITLYVSGYAYNHTLQHLLTSKKQKQNDA